MNHEPYEYEQFRKDLLSRRVGMTEQTASYPDFFNQEVTLACCSGSSKGIDQARILVIHVSERFDKGYPPKRVPYLTQHQVRQFLPYLQRFAETGELVDVLEQKAAKES